MQVSARYRDPIQDEPYASIQAVEPNIVAEEVQGVSDEAPTDTIVNGESSNYGVPAVAQRGRMFAKRQKGRRLVQKNGRSNVSMTKVSRHQSFIVVTHPVLHKLITIT